MFRNEADFEAFERVIVETHEREPIRILSHCVLSNHRNFVVRPEEDGQRPSAKKRQDCQDEGKGGTIREESINGVNEE